MNDPRYGATLRAQTAEHYPPINGPYQTGQGQCVSNVLARESAAQIEQQMLGKAVDELMDIVQATEQRLIPLMRDELDIKPPGDMLMPETALPAYLSQLREQRRGVELATTRLCRLLDKLEI